MSHRVSTARAAEVGDVVTHRLMVDRADSERTQHMDHVMYHPTTPEIARRRTELAPHTHEAFEAFSRAVFADGALADVTKQLIAVAVAHTTQCPYCIRGHTRLAHRKGATDEQIMEAIWVAAEMRAGGAYAHSTLALEELST
jgi:AhpD family alkylhydroperoxidase